jgi:hypothetical protein
MKQQKTIILAVTAFLLLPAMAQLRGHTYARAYALTLSLSLAWTPDYNALVPLSLTVE